MRRLAVSVLVVALVALLAGCGGEEEDKGLTAPTEDTEIVEETTVTTQVSARDEAETAAKRGKGDAPNTIMIDPNSPVSPNEQIESFRLGCQTFKAQQAEGPEAIDAYFQEAVNTGMTMSEVLSGRGYGCTDGEIRVWQRQD